MQFFHAVLVVLNIKSIFSLISFDLTHTIKSTNPIFPTLTPFNFTKTLTTWKQDDTNEYYFTAVNTFVSSEHFGTHIDAPYHGSNTSWTVEQIPFERLVSIQALIVDVSKKSSRIENYQIKIEDLNEDIMKKANGYFVLLFYTGKSTFWPDQETYAGGHIREELEFPGLSAELASYLANNYSEKLVGVGIDTLSSR
jgi:kynurenine formamidase